MMHFVYVCNGKVMGYNKPVAIMAGLTAEEERRLYDNLLLEGLAAEDNIVPRGCHFTGLVFNPKGEVVHARHGGKDHKLVAAA